MRNVVIAGYARSAFTLANKGALMRVRPDDMAARVISALIARTGVKPRDIEDVIVGCAFPEGEQGFNIGRMVALLAGLPLSAAGMTVNRFCGSSMQAVHIAAGQISLGAGEVFIAAGVESMSRVPMMGFNPLPNPAMPAIAPAAYISMGETAENVASKWDISRGEQEVFAVRSQRRAALAASAGYFAAELVPIAGKDGSVESDGCIRPDTTAAGLAQLKPAFAQTGAVTAGTSSPLTDGASALLICSEDYAMSCGLAVLGRIRSVAVAGCAPEIMGIGPVAATRKALRRANLDITDLDVVELNEAFASQALACVRELGIKDETLNIDGGAIALGHPLGATGARIVGKAATLLHRVGGRYALATQCIGGGQGIATILERI
jgi:acetyl-CoA acyltransferase